MAKTKTNNENKNKSKKTKRRNKKHKEKQTTHTRRTIETNIKKQERYQQGKKIEADENKHMIRRERRNTQYET